jgi:hypothetical protein
MLPTRGHPALDVYPLVRTVAPPDAPFEGTLARAPDGGSVLLVDRDALASWSGWAVPPGEHVLTPLDVVRRGEGHDVVFPMPVERLDRFRARRAASVPLTPGELLTLVVSVLRGTQQLAASGYGEHAVQWWLLGDGRPVVVVGIGDSTLARSAVDAVTGLDAVGAGALAPSLGETVAALADLRTLVREAPAIEDALFACGVTPEPLAREVLGSRRRAERTASAERDPEEVVAQPRAAAWAAVSRHFDAGLADAASDALERWRRRLGRRRHGRARSAVWAAAVAGIVLVVGLAWPEGAADDQAAAREAETVAPAPPGSPGPGSSPDPSPTASTAVPDDPAGALSALLAARRACADDACRAAGLEDSGRALQPGAVDAAEPVVTLLDDFGGLAVARVEDASGAATSQLVTVVATPEGWRIRDAFDVADPG